MTKLACLPTVTAPYPPLKDLPADLISFICSPTKEGLASGADQARV